jgi:hypothetical protein
MIFNISGVPKPIAYNVLQIKEVAEGNFGKSLISLLFAVIRSERSERSRQTDATNLFSFTFRMC